MKAAFCTVPFPLETSTRYEPSSRCDVSCAVSDVPSIDTVSTGRRSPARYTFIGRSKFAPVSDNVSPEMAAVVITTCCGLSFPCAAADVATARAHTREPTNRTTDVSFRDMRHLPCSKWGVDPG